MTIDIIYIVLLSALAAVVLVGLLCGMKPLWRTGRLYDSRACVEPQEAAEDDAELTAEEVIPAEEPSDDCYVLEEEAERVSELRAAERAALEKMRRRLPADINPSTLPSLSVIVYALCNEERLIEYIEELMQQSYPEFEVVVVFDGSLDVASDIADGLMSRYPSLRMTFIPPGSHNLSRRKLAWTLGLKGAENDVVITTAANAEIPSRDWLCRMAAPFANPEVDLVLGDTRFDFKELTGAGRWYHQFDRVVINAAWISRAMIGKAFRGDCYNMAFRRELFFTHNGYAASTGRPFGDDDVFVCQIASESNTRVAISPETLLTMDWGISTRRIRRTLKEQQTFAAQMLPKGPFIRQGLLSCCSWLTLILAATVIIRSLVGMLPEIPWPAIAAFILLLIFWGVQIAVYRRAAAALKAVRLWWSVPIFMLWRPIDNAVFRYRHRKAKTMDFIWNGYQ